MGDTQDILSVAESYKPGQGGIDGGGWKIIKKEPKGYLYQVFESEKIGYPACKSAPTDHAMPLTPTISASAFNVRESD